MKKVILHKHLLHKDVEQGGGGKRRLYGFDVLLAHSPHSRLRLPASVIIPDGTPFGLDTVCQGSVITLTAWQMAPDTTVPDEANPLPPEGQSVFVGSFNSVARWVHRTSKDHGFWNGLDAREPAVFGLKTVLIHSELSEVFEAFRSGVGDKPDTHCPEHPAAAVELADAVIRIMDLACAMGYDLGAAIQAKALYNQNRPYKHGKSC